MFGRLDAWADCSAAGAVLARYLQGIAGSAPLARWTPAGGAAWYLTDRLGSVRALANMAGQLIDQIDYNSYGVVVSESNPSAGDRFKFTGQQFEPTTGLYYYIGRYYDPATGRFISQDPTGFGAGDANLYRYVFNSPANFTDPSD